MNTENTTTTTTTGTTGTAPARIGTLAGNITPAAAILAKLAGTDNYNPKRSSIYLDTYTERALYLKVANNQYRAEYCLDTFGQSGAALYCAVPAASLAEALKAAAPANNKRNREATAALAAFAGALSINGTISLPAIDAAESREALAELGDHAPRAYGDGCTIAGSFNLDSFYAAALAALDTAPRQRATDIPAHYTDIIRCELDENERATLVSTDGHRLTAAPVVQYGHPEQLQPFSIPSGLLREILPALKKEVSAGTPSIGVSLAPATDEKSGTTTLVFGPWSITYWTPDIRFPDWKRVIPAGANDLEHDRCIIFISPASLAELAKAAITTAQCAWFTAGRRGQPNNVPLSLTFGNGTIYPAVVYSANNADNLPARLPLPAIDAEMSNTGGDSICLNARYLLALANTAAHYYKGKIQDASSIRLELFPSAEQTTAEILTPALFTLPCSFAKQRARVIIMPFRVD